MKTIFTTVAFAALIMLSYSDSAKAGLLVIDNFELAQSANTTVDDFNIADLGITADRTLSLSGNGSLSINNPSFPGVANSLAYLNGSVSSFSLTYDNFNDSAAAIDFTAGGLDRFVFSGVSMLTAPLTMTVNSFGGGTSTALVVLVDGALMYNAFSGNADFGQVTSLVLGASSETTFQGVTVGQLSVTTPEPSSLLLGGIGLVTLMGAAYRRRKNAA